MSFYIEVGNETNFYPDLTMFVVLNKLKTRQENVIFLGIVPHQKRHAEFYALLQSKSYYILTIIAFQVQLSVWTALLATDVQGEYTRILALKGDIVQGKQAMTLIHVQMELTVQDNTLNLNLNVHNVLVDHSVVGLDWTGFQDSVNQVGLFKT